AELAAKKAPNKRTSAWMARSFLTYTALSCSIGPPLATLAGFLEPNAPVPKMDAWLGLCWGGGGGVRGPKRDSIVRSRSLIVLYFASCKCLRDRDSAFAHSKRTSSASRA